MKTTDLHRCDCCGQIIRKPLKIYSKPFCVQCFTALRADMLRRNIAAVINPEMFASKEVH